MVDRILIKTITDYHIEDYLRNPLTFYHKHFVRRQFETMDTWQEIVQRAISPVMRDFFHALPSSRSVNLILQLLDRYWVKNVELYDSREHYFHILGSVTESLIEFLLQEHHIAPPLFLIEKLSTFITDWKASLSMTLPLVHWGKHSFVVKKLTVDENEELIRSWIHLCIFFFDQAFQRLPEKIEIHHILTGRTSIVVPNLTMVKEASDYLSLFKHTIGDPLIFQKYPFQ